MNKREYLIILYEIYGDLFTAKQKEYFEQYYYDNLSLQEISENLKVSRNAVYKVIKLMEEKLYFYENKLKINNKKIKINDIIKKIDNEEVKNELGGLF